MEIKDLYWVAGLIEGEGCFFLYESGNSCLRFSMSLTEKAVLEHAQKIIGLGTIRGPYHNKKRTKPFWVWGISRDRDVAALMMTLYPLMWDNRQETIDDLLEIWRSKPVVKHRNTVP